MSTNSIFVLKPILDLLYEEAKKDQAKIAYLEGALQEHMEHRPVWAKEHLERQTYKQELEELKKRVQVLEQYNRELVEENTRLKEDATCKSIVIDDAAYAAEATAPAHVYVEEKVVNEVVMEQPKEEEESTKTVKMVGDKTKKEYQREYQRAYRKKQKQITMNV